LKKKEIKQSIIFRIFKCEGGFYSAGQILALKDKELDWI
jgi:hypothetical protein